MSRTINQPLLVKISMLIQTSTKTKIKTSTIIGAAVGVLAISVALAISAGNLAGGLYSAGIIDTSPTQPVDPMTIYLCDSYDSGCTQLTDRMLYPKQEGFLKVTINSCESSGCIEQGGFNPESSQVSWTGPNGQGGDLQSGDRTNWYLPQTVLDDACSFDPESEMEICNDADIVYGPPVSVKLQPSQNIITINTDSGLTRSVSINNRCGSVVKVTGWPDYTYFYFGNYDHQIRRFVVPRSNASYTYDVFSSWYNNESEVIDVLPDDIKNYSIAGNAGVRPGTYLVKIQSDPKIYVVYVNNVLKYVGTEANYTLIEKLYGPNWRDRLLTIPDAFFVSYSIGLDWPDETKQPPGTLIQYVNSSDVYLLTENAAGNISKRKFVNNGFAANNYKAEYIVTNVDRSRFIYPDGPVISAKEPLLTLVAGWLCN